MTIALFLVAVFVFFSGIYASMKTVTYGAGVNVRLLTYVAVFVIVMIALLAAR